MTIRQDWDNIGMHEMARLSRADMDAVSRDLARAYAVPLPRGKRLFDITFSLLLLIPLSAVMGVVAVVLLLRQGRPIFYAAPRMKSPTEQFTQWKFRTMIRDDADTGASGAHKNWRITRIGHFLRRTRIDELPQLFNILRGDMSFVGPRPPLREYIDHFPVRYASTLQCRPGVTGLATVLYHRHEDRILARCRTRAATESAYYRRCLPIKLRIDEVYRRRQSLALDLWIIWRTVRTVISRHDPPPRRHRR